MRCRLTTASGVLLSACILLGSCAGGPIVTASRANWPVGPGETPEEVRAKRQAEAQRYLADRGNPELPKMFGVIRESDDESKREMSGKAVTATASITPSNAPAASRYGDLLFISGQLPLDRQGNALPLDSLLEDQARLALENVRAVLEANQLNMANVVSMTVYLTDLDDLAVFDGVAAGFFKRGLPPRSVVGVSQLPRGAKVQVSAVAGR
jgi:2-iminobutanoate/2-iminopropanoate deaminase